MRLDLARGRAAVLTYCPRSPSRYFTSELFINHGFVQTDGVSNGRVPSGMDGLYGFCSGRCPPPPPPPPNNHYSPPDSRGQIRVHPRTATGPGSGRASPPPVVSAPCRGRPLSHGAEEPPMLPPGSPHREGSAPHREGSGLESRFPRFLSLKCIRETANSRPQESPRTLQNPNETMSLPILTPTPFSRDVHVPFLARRRAFRVARAAAWALLLFAAAGAARSAGAW